LLRHVSEAFAEDPVRILRVARFAARFGFAVAPETMKLMALMVEKGEADALVPERVWQELARGLMERSPSRMIAVLRECGALARVLPEIDASFERPEVPEMLAERLDRAAARGYGLAVRFALLVLDLEVPAATRLVERVNAPNDCRDLAIVAIEAREVVKTCDADAESTLSLLERADSFRRPDRLDRLLEVAESDAHVDSPGRSGPANSCAARWRRRAPWMRERSRRKTRPTWPEPSAERGWWPSPRCSPRPGSRKEKSPANAGL
jgi:tRNA nucleotidyltransferase (CCA-adding enzyme)